MSEITTIARPYAKAIFELAQTSQKFDAWSAILNTLAQTMKNAEATAFVMHPEISNEQILTLFASILKAADLGEVTAAENMLRLLSENKRLDLLPEIADIYESFRADAMKTQKVIVESFSPLTEAQKTALTEKLNQRLNRQISLEITINPALIGGAVIRAGDLVIDGSVKGQLKKLARNLAA